MILFQSIVRVQGKHPVGWRGSVSGIERHNSIERIKTKKYAVDQRSRRLHRPRDETDDELDKATAQTVANGHHDKLSGQDSYIYIWLSYYFCYFSAFKWSVSPQRSQLDQGLPVSSNFQGRQVYF